MFRHMSHLNRTVIPWRGVNCMITPCDFACLLGGGGASDGRNMCPSCSLVKSFDSIPASIPPWRCRTSVREWNDSPPTSSVYDSFWASFTSSASAKPLRNAWRRKWRLRADSSPSSIAARTSVPCVRPQTAAYNESEITHEVDRLQARQWNHDAPAGPPVPGVLVPSGPLGLGPKNGASVPTVYHWDWGAMTTAQRRSVLPDGPSPIPLSPTPLPTPLSPTPLHTPLSPKPLPTHQGNT